MIVDIMNRTREVRCLVCDTIRTVPLRSYEQTLDCPSPSCPARIRVAPISPTVMSDALTASRLTEDGYPLLDLP